MKIGSLFDGSGTAPLAAAMCGIEPVWASEIEAYPIKVTSARFPGMKHLGSITEISGAEVAPVDIICGGSPCQDLSVAGKQKGLHEGERSHLFFEMTRIIKEMRDATNGRYPRYIIWENVPGAFSSNNGRDFLAVLQAFTEIADPDIHVPEPKQKAHGPRLAWKSAGYVAGDGWSIAWRTVDAQYWGVPQRRRRIYLIADLGGERADEILFKPEGMPWNYEPCGTPREETAGTAGSGPDRSGGFVGRQGAKSGSVGFEEGLSPTLRQAITADVVYSVQGNIIDRNAQQNGNGIAADVAPTINSTDFHGVVYDARGNGDGQTAPCLTDDHQNRVTDYTAMLVERVKCMNPWDSQTIRQYDADGIFPTLTSNTNGGQNRAGVVYAADCRNGALTAELSGTLQAKGGGGYSLNYQNPVVVDRGDVFEAFGYAKYQEGCGTLRASGGDCGPGSEMLYVARIAEQNTACVYPNITGPLMANSHPGSYTGQDAFSDMLPVIDQQAVIYPGVGITSKENASNPQPGDPAPTLSTDSRNYLVADGKPQRRYIVRRLTLLECCRLQGFPDWWTEGAESYPVTPYWQPVLKYVNPYSRIDGSDSAKYKMWGNGMAFPNMLYVMRSIAEAER